jgi:hypothetical protein
MYPALRAASGKCRIPSEAMRQRLCHRQANFPQTQLFDLLADWALPDRVLHREATMNRKNFLVGIAGCLAASAVLVPSVGQAPIGIFTPTRSIRDGTLKRIRGSQNLWRP